jgi:hypothetical protein
MGKLVYTIAIGLLLTQMLCACVALQLSGNLGIDDTIPPAEVSTLP